MTARDRQRVFETLRELSPVRVQELVAQMQERIREEKENPSPPVLDYSSYRLDPPLTEEEQAVTRRLANIVREHAANVDFHIVGLSGPSPERPRSAELDKALNLRHRTAVTLRTREEDEQARFLYNPSWWRRR